MSAAPKTVVLFGTFDESMHPRVRVLGEAAQSAGHTLMQCNEPLGVSTEQRVAAFRRPWMFPALAIRLLRAWWNLIRKARALDMTVDIVIVGYLGVFDVHLAKRLFKCPVILDQMATVGGIGRDRGLPLLGVLDQIDRLAAGAADIVLVDTAEHLSTAPSEALVVHVGAPEAWFAAQKHEIAEPEADAQRPLSICFFGLFTPLQGAETIAAAARRLGDRGDLRWTFIGHGQHRQSAEAIVGDLSNVTWIDWIDANDLPDVVASHDICLGIFGTTPKANRVVPNKVFQGAAAGCAIITSDTAPQRHALDGAGVLVAPGDAAQLADAIETLATDRSHLLASRNAARDRANTAFTPEAIAKQLGDIIDAASNVSKEEPL